MEDLPLSPVKKTANAFEYSVSELSQAVKRTVETSFDFVRVRGEISRPTYARSGHLYFTLKDDKSVLDVVSWKGTVAKLSVRAEEGLEIIATGKLTTYPGSSKYQLVMSSMELAGEGALLKLLEMRKKQLAAEGLFAPERKRRLPFLPKRIGVVTSPTGAVIRDILHRVADRFPRHVMLWPVKVQGEGAAEQVAKAIAGFNALPTEQRPDVLIVGRGGGSLEDLWAFNEEVVVRAIAQSDIPIVSAVGHETDTTLADFAADLRAPTPTGAAEQIVPVRQDLALAIGDLGQRMDRGLVGLAERKKEQLSGLARGLPQPETILEQSWQYLDQVSTRLEQAMSTRLSMASSQLMAQKLRHPREMLSFASQDLSREWQRAANAVNQGIKRTWARFDDFQVMPRMARASGQILDRRATELTNVNSLLEAYQSVEKQAMARGYARVETLDGQVMTSAAAASQQSHLRLVFADDAIELQSASNPPSSASQPPIVAQEQPHKSTMEDN